MAVKFLVEFTLGAGPWLDDPKNRVKEDTLQLEARWISHNQAEFANKQLNWSVASRGIDWVNYAAEFPKIVSSGLLTAAFRNDTLEDKEAVLALHTLAKYDESRPFKLIAMRSGNLLADLLGHMMATVTFDDAKVVDVVPAQGVWDNAVLWIANIDGRAGSKGIKWAG
jgi:hypothetical protein